jgi:hypothetical protein
MNKPTKHSTRSCTEAKHSVLPFTHRLSLAQAPLIQPSCCQFTTKMNGCISVAAHKIARFTYIKDNGVKPHSPRKTNAPFWCYLCQAGHAPAPPPHCSGPCLPGAAALLLPLPEILPEQSVNPGLSGGHAVLDIKLTLGEEPAAAAGRGRHTLILSSAAAVRGRPRRK